MNRKKPDSSRGIWGNPLALLLLFLFTVAFCSIAVFTVDLHTYQNATDESLTRSGRGNIASTGRTALPSRGNGNAVGVGALRGDTNAAVTVKLKRDEGVSTPKKKSTAHSEDQDRAENSNSKSVKPSKVVSMSMPVEGNGMNTLQYGRAMDEKHTKELGHLTSTKPKNSFDMHFIHIPKCGGTSMTTILRQVACELDKERNEDCCTNPGFCDFHAKRRCSAIKGCINHIPQTPWVYRNPPSITILREPQSRLISAWFYRGHSPNLDFFQVRPEFKEIKNGQRPKVVFDEYLDMPEYQNIQTRMLGADSFPYRNITITTDIFNSAVKALDNMFFIGIQEAYDLSVKIMLRELSVNHELSVVKERDQASSKKMKMKKMEILNNSTAIKKLRDHNFWDIELYKLGVEKFCRTAKKYPDLYEEVKKTKVKC